MTNTSAVTRAAVAAALAACMTATVLALPGCAEQQGGQEAQQVQQGQQATQEEAAAALRITRGDATRTYMVTEAQARGGSTIAWGKDTFDLGMTDAGSITCTYKGDTLTCCDGDDACIERGKVKVCFDKDFSPAAQSNDGSAASAEDDMSGCTSESCNMRSGGECNCEAGKC